MPGQPADDDADDYLTWPWTLIPDELTEPTEKENRMTTPILERALQAIPRLLGTLGCVI